jgi:tetratricopeptide (TPR) repeat protein
MRSSVHNMLASCGITKVDHAVSSGTAIRQVREKQFDLIMCEYDLAEGQDGQQLLEDLRNNNLIPLWTMYFILTAERSAKKVVSAAELAPTDYLLKPFTHDGMLERVGRAVERRSVFMPVFQLIEHGDLNRAVKLCEAGEAANPRLAHDFLRLRAECNITLGRAADAEVLDNNLLEGKSMGWARLGLANALFMQARYHEAENTLVALIEESNNFLDAYDLLAKTRQAMGKLEEARETLEQAVAISPHAVRRLRALGKLALDTGDVEGAEKVLSQVVSKSKYSEFRDPEDHVQLVTALVQKGDPKQAAIMLRDMDKSLGNQKKTAACHSYLKGIIHEANGETEEAALEFAAAAAACGDATGLSNDLKLALAKNCLEHDMQGDASTILLDVMNNSGDNAAAAKAIAVFKDAGHGDLAEEVAKESRRQVVALLSTGAEKAKAGDFRGAVASMTEAAHKMPENGQVIFNAAVAALKCLENVGWEDTLGENARWYIDNARRLDPANTRLGVLTELYIGILRKYKIPASQIVAKAPIKI